MVEKIDKGAALYFPAEDIGSDAGAKCGNCSQYKEQDKASGACDVVLGKISANGVCGLFVPRWKVAQKVAGYIADGPTHCGSCEYYGGGRDERSPCAKVEGFVQFQGCCSLWQRK